MCGLSTGVGVNSSSEMSGVRLVWLKGSSCISIPLFPILHFQEGRLTSTVYFRDNPGPFFQQHPSQLCVYMEPAHCFALGTERQTPHNRSS